MLFICSDGTIALIMCRWNDLCDTKTKVLPFYAYAIKCFTEWYNWELLSGFLANAMCIYWCYCSWYIGTYSDTPDDHVMLFNSSYWLPYCNPLQHGYTLFQLLDKVFCWCRDLICLSAPPMLLAPAWPCLLHHGVDFGWLWRLTGLTIVHLDELLLVLLDH
jgi:hypothetical protein